MMRDENVGSVIITNEGKPVGIVTDRDITTRVIAEGESPDDYTAENIMSEALCTGTSEMGLYEAAEMMSEHGVRRLPICDESEQLVGIITADDLTELLSTEMEYVSSVIEKQRPPY